MKISYLKLLEAVQGINLLLSKELDYRVGLKVSHTASNIQKVLENYQKECKNLEDIYLEKDDEGNPIKEKNGFKLKEDSKEEYWNKKKELDNFEVEVEIYTITSRDLEGIKLLPKISNSIEFMVTE